MYRGGCAELEAACEVGHKKRFAALLDCRVGDYVDFQFFRIVGVSEFYDFHLFPLILLYITARWA